jgi:hypothetical protein
MRTVVAPLPMSIEGHEEVQTPCNADVYALNRKISEQLANGDNVAFTRADCPLSVVVSVERSVGQFLGHTNTPTDSPTDRQTQELWACSQYHVIRTSADDSEIHTSRMAENIILAAARSCNIYNKKRCCQFILSTV